MKRYGILLFILSVNLTSLFSQTVLIIDNEDNKPVAGVAVYDNSKSLITSSNNSGRIEINAAAGNEIFCFYHFAFERVCLSYEEIKNAGFRILLNRKVFPIEEFVISASRWEQEREEVPNRISVIAAPVIEFTDPQTSADLIAASGDVFVQKSQLGGGSPMIRGFATNRILIVVDGVRMNNAIYREGNIQNVLSLDPSAVESTEIIFGPGAVVYGSDAIGGVMDFHTNKALLASGEKPLFRANTLARYSSANNENTLSAGFNIGGKKISFLTDFSWSDFDDLKMGSNKHPDYLRPEYAIFVNGQDSVVANPDQEKQVHSGYSQVSTLNKLRFKPGENLDIVFTNQFSSISDVPRYDRLIQYKSGELRYGDWYYGSQVWMVNNLQLSNSKGNKLYDEFRVTAARQDYKESRHDRSFGKVTINEQFEKLIIYSANLDFDKKISDGRDLFYYGAEYVFNDISSTAQTRDIITGVTMPAGSRYPNGINKYNSISAYAGYKSNITAKMTLNTGLRYNYVTLCSTISDNSFYNFPFTTIDLRNGALTGSIGLVRKTGDNSRINMNLSTGFRAPNLDDAGKVFDSAPGVVVVPNPDLKPEYATNIDLGYSKDLGSVLHFDITGFYTWLKNAMVRDDYAINGEDSIMYGGEMSKVEAVVNASYAIVYGIDLGLRVNLFHNFYLKSGLNITEGFEKGGIPLRHATPVFGSTHIVYESSQIKMDLFAAYNGAKKFSDMPPSEVSKPYMYATDENGNPWSPGWCTVNFKLSVNVLKWVLLNFGIENILDQRYRPYASGIVSPGRNFIISLRIKV